MFNNSFMLNNGFLHTMYFPHTMQSATHILSQSKQNINLTKMRFRMRV